ncbi:hypothetical protein [Natrinema sp. H-ect4]|uniref:DUF7344 domain-containing protein n=1 Tax=Natrinema sp. H-ect4 TaxID=3242699 RepID=UPI0035A997F8
MSIQHADALSDCGTEAPNAGSSGISTTEIHAILSNKRRLFLLEELVALEGKAEFNDLVDRVAQRELGISPKHPNWSDERKKVRVSLYQTHIKRLKQDGVVDYRSKTGTIVLGENSESVLSYLEVPANDDGFFGRVSDAFRAMCD